MKKIKILGTGCPNCKVLEKNTMTAVEELKLEAQIEKVTDIAKIMEYGVMSTPALVIDEKVVSYGKVISSEEIKKLLK
ncbi:MAG: thioredoxin family protein [Nanoarchaeota archaeon]|jgi:small redox-active disulfide protein 2|nr:thioredoxin family protein [Nanoarchaeota archaeon]